MSDRIASGVLIAISVAFIVMATRVQTTFFTDPVGPKLVPIVIGIFLISASLALLWQPLTVPSWPDGPTWVRLALCLVGFIGYGYLLNPLGFIAATTLAYTLFAILFRGRPLPALAAGVIFSVAAYLLFSTALDLYLPTGRLFEGLF